MFTLRRCLHVSFSFFKDTKSRLKPPKEYTTLQKSSKYAVARTRVRKNQILEDVRSVDPKILEKKPLDDVWLRRLYAPAQFEFVHSILRHRELAVPEMLNNVDGVVQMVAAVDMRTKKKTKFINGIKSFIRLPFDFVSAPKKIVAFCKTDDEIHLALELGALYAGCEELMQQIESKDLLPISHFDHVIATPEALDEITDLRRHLKELYPRFDNGTLGSDVRQMMMDAQYAIVYESIFEDEKNARLEIPFGKLSMPISDLEANFDAFLTHIFANRPSQSRLGPFLTHVLITCPPSPEAFLLERTCIDSASTKGIVHPPKAKISLQKGEVN